MRWRPACLRPNFNGKADAFVYKVPNLPTSNGSTAAHSKTKAKPKPAPPSNTRTDIAYVELLRRDHEPLGLIIGGGTDHGEPVTVEDLRPTGVAKRSESLEIGDRIRAVNGTSTAELTHNAVVHLLQTSGNIVNLEIEYDLPVDAPTKENNVVKKTQLLNIQQEADHEGFGFKLRGGRDEGIGRRLTFAYIRPGSEIYKRGGIKVGDRLLKINGVDMTNAGLSDAITRLRQSGREVSLEVEYDVTIQVGLDSVDSALLIELVKPTGTSLGITLSGSHIPGEPIVISQIRAGGIADRCGAMNAGDKLLSINEYSLDSCTLPEAVQMLANSDKVVRLEILPIRHELVPVSREDISLPEEFPSPPPGVFDAPSPPPPMTTHGLPSNSVQQPLPPASRGSTRESALDSTCTSVSTLTASQQSMGQWSRNGSGHVPRQSLRRTTSMSSTDGVVTRSVQHRFAQMQLCRQETLEIDLLADPFGYGFSIQGGATQVENAPIIVSSIEKDSPADRCAVLQVGDRVLTINGTDVHGLTLEQVCKIIRTSGGSVLLLVEFDVAEGVVPTSGTFDVKLAKQGDSLGITINGHSLHADGGMWISQVKRGGIAYRSGMVQPGDSLLAINARSVRGLTLADAAELLKANSDIVTLHISKDEQITAAPDSLEFSVELVRHGESLGITINGSNMPGEPIYISQIREGGVAFRTGALCVGDVVLSINGHSLSDCNLQATVSLLQNAGDRVLLRICRSRRPCGSDTESFVSSAHLGQEWSHQSSVLVDSDDTLSEGSTPSSHRATISGVSASNSSSIHNVGQRTPAAVAASLSHMADAQHKQQKKGSKRQKASNPGSGPQTPKHAETAWPAKPLLVTRRSSLRLKSLNKEKEQQKKMFRQSLNAGTMSVSQSEISAEGEGPTSPATATVTISPSTKRRSVLGLDEPAEQSTLLQELENSLMGNSTFSTMFTPSITSPSDSTASSTFAMAASAPAPAAVTIATAGNPRLRSASSRSTLRMATPSSCVDRVSLGSCESSVAPTIQSVEMHVIELWRPGKNISFGFSISDGKYEPGVYVRNIQPGGLADQSGQLQALDRLLQVNDVDVRDFDCRRTMRIVSSAADTLKLVICRCPTTNTIPTLASPH